MPAQAFCPAPLRLEPLILVQEISHRVVNEYTQAIAGIRLAAAGVASPEGRLALVAAATQLHVYAEAHRALQAPAFGGGADLGLYLQTLCSAITAASLQERGIRLTLAADTVNLPADRCWRVALIVSELITNAVRHGLSGGPGHIFVKQKTTERVVTCSVSNSGEASRAARPGCGMAVVQGLATELDGIVSWRSENDWTSAELVFPLVIPEKLA
jgi:two-component sensor histidine kinase